MSDELEIVFFHANDLVILHVERSPRQVEQHKRFAIIMYRSLDRLCMRIHFWPALLQALALLHAIADLSSLCKSSLAEVVLPK